MANRIAKGRTRYHNTIIDKEAVPVIEAVACDHCRAPVGIPCHTPKGEAMYRCHVVRGQAYETKLQRVKRKVEEVLESGDLRAVRSLLRP